MTQESTSSPKLDFAGMERHTTCSTAGALFYWTKDGKITRVAPMKFEKDEIDPWRVTVNGLTFTPPATHPLLPWGLAGKQMAYSENRVLYPMKRVDWDPKGNRNTQTRGISKYERISWDEAYDLLEDEMRRCIDVYDTSSIAWSFSAHPEWGQFHYFFSDTFRFFDYLGAARWDYTPISWEGWSSGATLLWGRWLEHGIPGAANSLQDLSRNSDTIVMWGNDPLMRNVYAGITDARVYDYWKKLGKTIIVIDPIKSDTAATYADKWIPIIPGTDGALACAIAYIWIAEGTYDKDYIATHAFGFDETQMPEGVDGSESFKAYILGESADKTPKTPEWAEGICGVSAHTIRDLAHVWAAGTTAAFCMHGGLCRRQHSDTTTRLLATLSIMQGLGKPGVSVIGDLCSLSGPYDAFRQVGPPGYADGGMNSALNSYQSNHDRAHHVSTQLIPDLLEKGSGEWFSGELDVRSEDEYYQPYHYPFDVQKGDGEIHFLWGRGSTVVNQSNNSRMFSALRNPKIETFVVQAPWFDRNCRYADLVLPTTSLFERQDMTEPGSVGTYVPPACNFMRSAVYHQKGIEELGESRTDMEIFLELSRRFGFDDYYMEGRSEEDILQQMYKSTTIPMDFDEFKEKGYYVWPKPADDTSEEKQFQTFFEDPVANPIDTPTGKFEIFSTVVYKHFGFNDGIPCIPKYVPEEEGVSNLEARKTYPLQVTMAHPKYRFHGKYNDCSWLTENYKIKGPDGYDYEPIWMNTQDAKARGLKDGDIVRVFNDRGSILSGLKVSERLVEGTIWLTYGSWNDPLNSEGKLFDRAGDGNVLTNDGPMSPNHFTGAFNSVLLQVEKADLEALEELYPEGFAGKYYTGKRGAQ